MSTTQPRFQGVFYPSVPERRSSYRDLTRSEISDLIKGGKFDNLPVVVEHNESDIVGRVNRAYVDSRGDARCEFSAIGPPDRIAAITTKIKQRELPEMSLHHVLGVYDAPGGVVIDDTRPIELKEISLTKRGARRGTSVAIKMSESGDGRSRGDIMIASAPGDVEVIEDTPAVISIRHEPGVRQCRDGEVKIPPAMLRILETMTPEQRAKYRYLSQVSQ